MTILQDITITDFIGKNEFIASLKIVKRHAFYQYVFRIIAGAHRQVLFFINAAI
jgi:hypothetical protein